MRVVAPHPRTRRVLKNDMRRKSVPFISSVHPPIATRGKPPAREARVARRDRVRALLVRPALWTVLTALMATVQLYSGPHFDTDVLFLAPIALAAWFGPLWIAVVIAVVTPMARVAFVISDAWEPYDQLDHVLANCALRIAATVLIAALIHRARRVQELEREVTALRGLLPICMYCKHVQDGDGDWHAVERYVGERSEAAFTHQVCPSCVDHHHKVFFGEG